MLNLELTADGRSLMASSLYTPEFDEFCALAQRGNLVPVFREILADLETPVSAFLKIDASGDGFLLESVEGTEKWARYSFLGTAPDLAVSSKGNVVRLERPGRPAAEREVADPLVAIRELLARYRPVQVKGLPRFSGGLVGYLSYDLVRFFEKLPVTATDDLGMPDLHLLLADTLLIFDNVAHKIKVVAHAHLDEGADLRAEYDKACAKVERLIARLQRPVEAPRLLSACEPGPIGSNLTQEQY